ncbi:sulfatase-like hydrolase/transferase [Streptomyces bacillaris]
MPGADHETSLLIVTLDSCRHDSAERANTPFLDSLAPLQLALAHATFTLPAHHALFSGYFPLTEGDLGPESPAVLRTLPTARRSGLRKARGRGFSTGANLVDALRLLGHRTVGAGGVRWFGESHLRTGFSTFLFWGPSYQPADRDLPVWAPEDFALSHAAELVGALPDGPDPWLLFVNAAETHAPYLASNRVLGMQRTYADVRNAKTAVRDDPVFTGLMAELAFCQAAAVEVVDARLRTLFDLLPTPFDFVITADHGESFGEGGIWGHVHCAPEVFRVPMWQGRYEGNVA